MQKYSFYLKSVTHVNSWNPPYQSRNNETYRTNSEQAEEAKYIFRRIAPTAYRPRVRDTPGDVWPLVWPHHWPHHWPLLGAAGGLPDGGAGPAGAPRHRPGGGGHVPGHLGPRPHDRQLGPGGQHRLHPLPEPLQHLQQNIRKCEL